MCQTAMSRAYVLECHGRSHRTASAHDASLLRAEVGVVRSGRCKSRDPAAPLRCTPAWPLTPCTWIYGGDATHVRRCSQWLLSLRSPKVASPAACSHSSTTVIVLPLVWSGVPVGRKSPAVTPSRSRLGWRLLRGAQKVPHLVCHYETCWWLVVRQSTFLRRRHAESKDSHAIY